MHIYTCTFCFIPHTLPKKTSEHEIFVARIDSLYKDLIEIDIKQIDQMIQMSLRINEYTALADLFKDKKLYAAQQHVIMNQFLANNNLDSAYYHYREVERLYKQDNKTYSLLINRLNAQFIVWCFANNYTSLGSTILNNYIVYKNKKEGGVSNPYWIYSVLLVSYGLQNRTKEVMETANIMIEMPIEDSWSELYKAGACLEMANCKLILNEPAEALMYCKLFETHLNKIPESLFEDPYALLTINTLNISHKTYKSASYSYLQDFDKAHQVLVELDKLVSTISAKYKTGIIDSEIDILASVNWAYMVYFIKKGYYQKADEYLTKNKQLGFTPSLYPESKNIYKWEAIIDSKMGKYKNANIALLKQMNFKDSLYNANLTKEINSTWAMFEVEESQQERVKSELKTEKLLILCISIGLLASISILLIIYFFVTNKKLKEKNRVLFLQQKKDLITHSPIINNNKNTITDSELTVEKTSETIMKNNTFDLYTRIVEYLQDPIVFTSPLITRELVAKELGTNRQYVIEAITENANMTFNEFINNLRLDYARNMLVKKENVLIKTIFREAGFTNRNTFSQLFKDKYAMSPSEFRDCAKEEFMVRPQNVD